MKLPAQKGILRISDTDRAVQPMYLYDPEKDDRDLELEPPRNSSRWGPRPYTLAEIVYEYDTEDERQLDCQRDAQDHFYKNHTHPLHQFLTFLEDGGRRRFEPNDTGNESLYSQWQPGIQLKEVNWIEDYNYIRLGESSIHNEAYRDWYEPQLHSLDQAITYWVSRRRQLERCQANHPLSYEAFLRANQPAEGQRTTPGTTDNCTDCI